MNISGLDHTVVPNVRVPRSVVQRPETFGAVPDGDCLCGDLVIRDGRAAGLHAPTETGPAQIVTPRFTEAHVRLDKCHTVDRMDAVGGDLRAAIEAQAKDRLGWIETDLRARATRGLNELVAAGCSTVRSHVDWPWGEDATTPPVSWHVLTELAQDRRDEVTLQISPLLSTSELVDAEKGDTIGRLVAEQTDVIGVFILDQPDRADGIKAAFRIAQAHDLMLDFHVDEGLADGLDGLTLIAEEAIRTGFDAPILCGHACSLMNVRSDALTAQLDLIAQAELSVVSLPSTNLYLQGRDAGTPDRRGLTRIRELAAAGVNVAIGTDNVRDAFCPLGRHDPRQSLALAALAAHLDPPYGDHLPMITTSAARAMGLSPTYVDGAKTDELLITPASDTSEWLSSVTPPALLKPTLKGVPA